jgi:rubrerythrin
MDLDQALKTAIQYETKIRDVYRKSAEQTPDETGKRILGLLADEEQLHLDFLREKLHEWSESGRITRTRPETTLPPGEVVAKSLGKVGNKLAGTDRSSELELLKQALEAEKETSSFYHQVVQELDGEGRTLFEPFVEIEDGHITIVQAEIDSLNGLGYWYDFMEFNLESG